MAAGFDWCLDGVDDVLAGCEAWQVLNVLGKGFARNGQAVTVQNALLEQILDDGRRAPNLLHILHHVLAAGLEVSNEGHTVADFLEVVELELDANGAGNGNQMEHGIRRATQSHCDSDCILKGLACHDVLGGDVVLKQILDRLPSTDAFVELCRVFGRDGRTVWQGHAEGFNGSSHGVGRVHASASAGAWACVTNNVVSLVFVDTAGNKLTKGLEGTDNVEGLLVLAAASTDGTTVDHQGRTVHAAHGDQAARHVLVAARDGDVCIVPLRTHHRLDRVGNDLAGLQGVTHARSAHGDTVTDTNGVEPVAHKPGLGHTLLDLEGQLVQMHVARVALIPDGRDADLGLLHVLQLEAGGIKHGLGRTLGLGLRDGGAVAVHLAVLCGIHPGPCHRNGCRSL
eukprot:comp23783_c0_seq1/m.41266 comp23783_c0_seq1/g.41266  ORF comp23783_c0_seq1/g.41266 comp23783_c0_seq1/m.41266 type:complete len:398 (+) comp23783_c0_seq1:1029-2222(+)